MVGEGKAAAEFTTEGRWWVILGNIEIGLVAVVCLMTVTQTIAVGQGEEEYKIFN